MDKKVYEFISTQAKQPILEWRTCKASGEVFPIYQMEKEMLDKISPTIGWEKFMLDMPNYAYWVRMLMRMNFRNEKKFCYAKTKNTQKTEISIVHDSVRDVLSPKDWYEEDFYQYGIDYSGDFQQDLKKLFSSVPYLSRFVLTSENSEYCNQTYQEKDCYLCAWGQNGESCMYTMYDLYAKYILDCHGAFYGEIGYESIMIFKSFKFFYCTALVDCYNTRFSVDLKNCKNVLFGYGLDGAEYIFKNKKLDKEEWEKVFAEYQKKIETISGLQEVIKEYEAFLQEYPRQAVRNVNVEWCIGTQINNSKNTIFWFGTDDSNDSIYCGVAWWWENFIDIESTSSSPRCYNCIWSIKMHGCISIANNFDEMKNSYYDLYMRWSEYMLWCFGFANQSHCILNKRYAQEEWETLTKKIITELKSKWIRGQFLDTELSPFPYNDSVANKFFPIKNLKVWNTLNVLNPDGVGTVEVLDPEAFISDALLDLGGEEKLKIKWRNKDLEINIPEHMVAIAAKDLPNNINDVTDDILKKVVLCAETGRPFRIMKLELDFYRSYHLPLPIFHPDVRDVNRYKKMPNRWLDIYTCAKCNKETLAEYAPNDTRKVYCEACYNKEIYW